MSTHDLKYKSPLVAENGSISVKGIKIFLIYFILDLSPLSSCHDSINHLNDPMQGWVGSNGHVRATEVIVNGANHANNVEHRVTADSLFIDET